jgi:hypothetical protein
MAKFISKVALLMLCNISIVFAENSISAKAGAMSYSRASQEYDGWFGSLDLLTADDSIGTIGFRALYVFPVGFSLDDDFHVSSQLYAFQVIKPIDFTFDLFNVRLTSGIGPAFQRTSFDYTGEPDIDCFGCSDVEFQNSYLLLSGLLELDKFVYREKLLLSFGLHYEYFVGDPGSQTDVPNPPKLNSAFGLTTGIGWNF